MDSGSDVSDEIAAMRSGEGEPGALIGEFRRAAVLVPLADGGMMSAARDGIRWIYAFTDEEALSRFARARGAAPDEEWEYLSVLGARLLDIVIPSLGVPAGVAVNVADEDGSMLLPPARGIVPDAVAVDYAPNGADRTAKATDKAASGAGFAQDLGEGAR
ncbi:SseB family protein [Streptomyces sp. LX-29]|uniref:SseB family protein n=1 Tax=Streptomyces sp. LX-29 TaxID=2900152 RepID=UPI00240D08A2|nr:SseB family protein [Streptomyces sp. LX-29]WFB09209.1 SseB family protein [Streptomyces sp. LX-29]